MYLRSISSVGLRLHKLARLRTAAASVHRTLEAMSNHLAPINTRCKTVGTSIVAKRVH